MTLQSSELQLFSASANGRNINIAATTASGTAIHAATSLSTAFDQMYIYASNTAASACLLTLEFGGTLSVADRIIRNVYPQAGDELIVSGRPLNGGVTVRAFASTASVVNVGGFIIRVTNE